MESLEAHFDSFIASFPQADAAHHKALQVAFHAGAAAVCAMLSEAEPEQYPTLLKKLEQEEHAFGRKEL
jgi:hypothetical protein